MLSLGPDPRPQLPRDPSERDLVDGVVRLASGRACRFPLLEDYSLLAFGGGIRRNPRWEGR